MPLITALFLASVAGLLLGFHGATLLVAGLAVGATLAIALRLHSGVIAIAAAGFAFGYLTAGEASRQDAVCRSAIVRRSVATTTLLSALRPGRSAPSITVGECRIRIRLSTRDATLDAGTVVRVAGSFARAGDGLAIRANTIDVVASPAMLARARNTIGRFLDRSYQSDGPMARALVIADQHDVDRDLLTRFADAGIVHMVSVSGLHVSIIAGGLVALALGVGAGRRSADIFAIAALAGYIVLIGAPAPAVRSAAMLTLTALARIGQRPTSVWAIWAIGSGVSLVEPRTALDLGWQLSASGMAGLLASGSLMTRLNLEIVGWRKVIADGVIATAVASAITAPIVAWEFGRLSIVAVLTNLAAAPLFNIAQPLLFASVLSAPLGVLSDYLADAARAALWMIDVVARVGAKVPLGVLALEPSAPTAFCLALAAVGFTAACTVRRPGRMCLLTFGTLVAAVWWPLVGVPTGRMELHALDVGQGDAIAIRSPKGRWLVVDAGRAWTGSDAGARVVLPFLRRSGGDVVHVVMTHPHADHIGGVSSLLMRARVDTLWDSGFAGTSPLYREVLATAERRHVVWKQGRAGDVIEFDGMQLRVLAPSPEWLARQGNPNEASVVLQVRFGAATFLLTGDAELGEEAWLVEQYGASLRSDVLKLGHHGSETSSSAAFLDAVAPRLAIASVGVDNDYGHPSPSVLQTLAARGIEVLRTDVGGTIMIGTDGHTFDIVTTDARWRASFAR